MLFSQINPFIRYARFVDISKKAVFEETVPLDARLFYALKGNGKIKVENTIYDMSPGGVLIINSSIPYHILTPDLSVSYIAINFDYTQAANSSHLPVIPVPKNEFKNQMLINHNTFDDTTVLSEVLYIKKNEKIQSRLSHIVNEYTKKMMYNDQKSGHILADCIIDCLRQSEFGYSSDDNESTDKILTYILENYRSSFSNSDIGKALGYHPNYVSYLVKRLTGMSLHKYILSTRLMYAANLLENTSLSIGEIALECGFPNIAYFSAYFKKDFGVSPSKYRNV